MSRTPGGLTNDQTQSQVSASDSTTLKHSAQMSMAIITVVPSGNWENGLIVESGTPAEKRRSSRKQKYKETETYSFPVDSLVRFVKHPVASVLR